MPYESDAQRRWAHTASGEKALGGPAKVHEWDEASKGKDLPERKHSMKGYATAGLGHAAKKTHKTKTHDIKRTHIESHDDGSHAIRHVHDDDSESTHGAADLDALHDHLEEQMGTPNEGEAEANS
jgi:hypothetical protein